MAKQALITINGVELSAAESLSVTASVQMYNLNLKKNVAEAPASKRNSMQMFIGHLDRVETYLEETE
jgi:hypothetical protein